MNTLARWYARQTFWKLLCFGLGLMVLAALEYVTSIPHPFFWVPRWVDIVPDIVNTCAVLYTGWHLATKRS